MATKIQDIVKYSRYSNIFIEQFKIYFYILNKKNNWIDRVINIINRRKAFIIKLNLLIKNLFNFNFIKEDSNKLSKI